MDNNFKIIGVHYVADKVSTQWDSETYYYKIDSRLDIKVDDRVYIKNTVKENLAVIVSVLDDIYDEDGYEIRYTIPKRFLKIDLTEILEAEAQYERLNQLERFMDSKLKEIEKIQKYELLKELDPSFAEAYEEFTNLRKELNTPKLIEGSSKV